MIIGLRRRGLRGRRRGEGEWKRIEREESGRLRRRGRRFRRRQRGTGEQGRRRSNLMRRTG